MATTIDEKELKNLLKAALAEALEEHRALMKEIVEDALEELALARAIETGLESNPTSRDKIVEILESAQ